MSSIIPGVQQGQIRTLYNELARFGENIDTALISTQPSDTISAPLLRHARGMSTQARENGTKIDERLIASEHADNVAADAPAGEGATLVLGLMAENVNRVLTTAREVFDADTLKGFFRDAVQPRPGDGAPVDDALRKRAFDDMFQHRLRDLAP